jgi:hypothetical protein
VAALTENSVSGPGCLSEASAREVAERHPVAEASGETESAAISVYGCEAGAGGGSDRFEPQLAPAALTIVAADEQALEVAAPPSHLI